MKKISIKTMIINNHRRELLHGPKTAMFLRQAININKINCQVIIYWTGQTLSFIILFVSPLMTYSVQFRDRNVSRSLWSSVGQPSQCTGNNTGGEESHINEGALFVTFEHYFISLVTVISLIHILNFPSICYLLRINLQ